MNAPVLCQFALKEAGGPALSISGGAGQGTTKVQLATLGGTHLFSSRFLVDGTVGFSRYAHSTRGPDFGTNFGSDVLGIPGTNGPDIRQSGMPRFDISNYESLGNTATWSPVDRRDNSWTFTTNANWSTGKHDIRFGADIARQHMNHWQPELGGRSPRGNFRFTGGVTALRGGTSPNRYNAMADFLLGLPQNLGKALQFYDPMTTREWLEGYYFRDRWQATSKLTLTLGLRWEYYPLITRTLTGIERYDPNENKVYIGGQGSVPDNAGINVSKTLLAPRFGIAYRLGTSGVLRTGYGITVDPYPMARPMRSPYPVVIFSDHEGANSFQPFGPILNGIPPITGPDISKGIIDIPPTIGTRTMEKGDFKRGYIQSWNLIYEREMPFNLVGSVGYVATRSIRQIAQLELNTAPPGTGSAGRPLFVKFGRSASTQLHIPWQTALYDSLQASLDRRFSGGVFVKTAYTWSKAINFQDNSGNDNVPIFMHPSVHHRQRALAGYDRTHNLRMAWIYEFPFGSKSGGLARAVLGGWQLNGIFSAYSGTPFTVGSSGASLNAPGNGQVADQVKADVKKLGGIGLGNPFFDPTAFAPVTAARFGNSGRNTLRGPGAVNVDLGLFRKFQVTERVEMQFRAEAFNFTNTSHFNNPNATASDPSTFMMVTSAQPDERNIRFAMRLSF